MQGFDFSNFLSFNDPKQAKIPGVNMANYAIDPQVSGADVQAGQLGGSNKYSAINALSSSQPPMSVAGGTKELAGMAPQVHGQEPGIWDSLKNSLSGAMGDLKNNPAKWAIVMDYLGTRLDPSNTAAGLGTMLGKSQLANQARNEQKLDIGTALAQQPLQGQVQNEVQGSALSQPTQPTQPRSSVIGGNGKSLTQPTKTAIPGLTPAASAGFTLQSQQAKPDGSVETTMKHTTPAPPQPQTSISHQDLLGLSPSEIGAIANRDVSIGALNQAGQKNVADAQYKQAVVDATNARTPAINYAARMLGLQRKGAALKSQVDAAIAANKAPAEIAKLQSEYLKTLQETRQLQSTNDQNDERQQIIANLGDQNISTLPDSDLLKILSGNNVTSLLNTTKTQGRLTDKDTTDAINTQYKTYADAVANAFSNSKPAAAIGDITRANQAAPDTDTRVLTYNNGDGFFNTEKVEWVDLPMTPDGKQITMKDVKENAKKYGMENAIQMALQIGQGGN